jgi:hypothetical protein
MKFNAAWQGGPAALWLRDFTYPVVAARIPVARVGRETDEICDCVLVNRQSAARLLQLIRKMTARRNSPYLHIFGSGRRLGTTLELDEALAVVFCKDFLGVVRRADCNEELCFDARLLVVKGFLKWDGSVINAVLAPESLNLVAKMKAEGYTVTAYMRASDGKGFIPLQTTSEIAVANFVNQAMLREMSSRSRLN